MEEFSTTTIFQTEMSDVLVKNSTDIISEEADYVYEPALSRPALLAGYIPFIVVTVVGNLLVIVAYCRYEQVRSVPTNTLIFSLSVSDFLVGVLVLTINLVWVYKDYWPFGELFCRIWSALDYTATFMSTLVIILISFDRLLMVTSGPRYQVVWTRKKAACASAVAWVFSMAFFTTVAFAMHNYDLVDFREECELEFVYNVPFSVALLILEFVIPFPVIVVLNLWVYIHIYQRSRRLGRVKIEMNVPSVDLRSAWPTKTDASDESQQQGIPNVVSSKPVASGFREATGSAGVSSQAKKSANSAPSTSNAVAAEPAASASRLAVPVTTTSSAKEEIKTFRRKQRQLSRHRKAAITLCILVCSFVTCWLPYEIVSIGQAMCGDDDCFSEVVWEAVNGLLWCNSALNPILYGLTNPQLRRFMLAWLRPPRAVGPQ